MGGIRAFSAGIGLLVATFGLTTAAEADARACRRLEARLASLPAAGDGDPGIYQRYDAAVSEQRDELAAAKQRAQSLECAFSLGSGNAGCRSINMKIERMEANLADLQRKRSLLAKRQRGGYDRERAMLQAQMEAEGCSGERHADRLQELERPAADRVSNEGGLFDMLQRGGLERLRSGADDNVISVPSGEDDYSIRAYRTMCVRTCDGYYFPMSPASSRDDFARDQQNCESICPGTDLRIYYQPSGLADVGTMMSAAGEEPYTDLPTAYLYRRADVERPPACGCGQIATVQNYSIIAGAGSAAEEAPAAPVIPHPWSRPDAAADPETLANAEGSLDGAQIRELLKPKTAKLPPPGERKVRVVGPAFLPDPSEAEAPPIPDRTTVR
jgi:hypothetical protein